MLFDLISLGFTITSISLQITGMTVCFATNFVLKSLMLGLSFSTLGLAFIA